MKLNERNIDDWLHNNLNDAHSQLESDLLQEILQKNKIQSRNKRFLLWLNIFFISAGLSYSVYLLKNQNIQGDIITQGSSNQESKNSNAPSTYQLLPNEFKKELIETTIEKKLFKIITNKTIALSGEIIKVADKELKPDYEVLVRKQVLQVDISKKKIKPFYPSSEINDFKITALSVPDSALNPKTEENKISKVSNDLKPKKKKSALKQLIQVLALPVISYEISSGYTYNQTKISKNTTDSKHTHKNYQNVVSDAFTGNNGFDLSAGFRLGYTKFTLAGALNYSHSVQSLQFKVPNWDVPVIDQNGEIKGYIELNDTTKKIQTQGSRLVQNEVSLPLSVSIKRNLTQSLTLELGLGVLPKLKTFPKLTLPGTADMFEENRHKIKPNFSSPATIRVGVYKKLPVFTIGLNGSYTPFYSSPVKLPGELTLRNRQTNIQLSLIKQL